MDSTEVIIAKLVLGYLKSEKCRTAYKEFCRTSKILQSTGVSKSKYLPTRFFGLTLEDILSQYFEIYKIVQGRLEATNYYNEGHTRNSLVEQLLYLLSKSYTSRASTPCSRSPLDSNIEESSPSHVDPISDVETTPAHTLPGNMRCVSEDSYLYKTFRRKPHSKYNKSDSIACMPVTDPDDMSEVLAQTLLENKEFHEKIAQTINKVAEKQYRVSSELDKTIKSVVRETEEDPIFDKILDEIIGSTAAIDASKGFESVCVPNGNTKNINENVDCRSKNIDKRADSSESRERTYRPCPDSKKVEEQNNEAIRSIIANAKLTSNTQVNNQSSQSNNEVILFEGSLDKYLTSNTCNANTQTQPIQNPLYINAAGNLLMVPSTIPTNVSGGVQIDTSKQYYFVNKQSTVGWNMPPLKTPTILTEQDILNMPTVIVNDDKQNETAPTNSVQAPQLKTVKTLKTLIPKPTIEVPNEYYAQMNVQNSQKSNLETVATNTQPESVNKNSNSDLPTEANTNAAQKNAKSFPTDLLDDHQAESRDTKSETCQRTVPEPPKDEPSVKTPHAPVPSQKVTPKSGTHVRNLDFSTPPKITSTQKKLIKKQRSEISPSVHKKQAVKSLFKPKDENDAEKNTKSKVTKSVIIKKRKRPTTDIWDADLRAIISTAEVGGHQTPRKKQKTAGESTKKIKKKCKKINANCVKENLNTTDQAGALIEAALQTPIKDNTEPTEGSDELKIKEEDVKTSVSEVAKGADVKSDNITTEISKWKKCKTEAIEDVGSKTILSPSKMNANKRNLVNTSSTPVDGPYEFVTPETIKENFHHPITHAKNITLLLSTPLKNDVVPSAPLPMTPMNPAIDPNLSLSCSVFTPFSKMLEANLKGVDINSLPTPSIPATPDFPPLTPNVDLTSPYANRPTDYSTSSSYYHPSDNEQNKSLEANLIELEKNPIKIHSDILIVKKEIIKSEDKEIEKFNHIKSPVNEHLNIFNKSVIGKKNLNLMERESSSNSNKSSSSSSSDESDNSWEHVEKNNKTVICRKKPSETPKRTYSLRNRTTSVTSKENISEKPTEIKSIKTLKNKPKNPNVNSKETSKLNTDDTSKIEKTTENNKSNMEPIVVSSRQDVLKDLAEKRLRTIEKIKTVEKDVPKKPAAKLGARQRSGKFMKIKPIPNLTSVRRKPRKSDSPKKTVKREKSDSENNLSHYESKQANSTSQNIKEGMKFPINKLTGHLEKTEKSSSDAEAQNLIEGLKERGIHLMYKKSSPTKKSDDSEPLNEPQRVEENAKEMISFETLDDSSDRNVPQTNVTLEAKEKSTSELHSEIRDTYDTCTFDGETVHVIFNELETFIKTFSETDKALLLKTFLGKVYVEEVDKEFDVPLVITPFDTLIEIPSTSGERVEEQFVGINEKSETVATLDTCNGKKTEPLCNVPCITSNVSTPTYSEENLKSDDDLMNYAITGSVREANPEGSESPKSVNKRKVREEDNSHTEKKCKTLLKKINVESFLNNIHGGN